MRLRIVHQLSLLLAGIALLSMAAVGGLVAWNLRAGFTDYLRSRDQQQLERFAEVVAQRVDWTVQPPAAVSMRELVDEFMHREGQAPPPDWRPPPPGAGAGGRPPPPRPRPPEGPGQRIQVVDAKAVHLGGPRFNGQRPLMEQPVRAGGTVVAYVRMLPSEHLEGVDAGFLRRQYLGLAIALAATLALALVAAMLAARWLGAPLRRLQEAAHRIAGGEFGVVTPESGSREMAELISDVNRMAASLQQLEGARRRWIAQISHELRTPLSVLLGELEAMQEGVRQATPQMLANLREEVLQLVRLVNDLHTLSMADLRALPCEFSDGRVSDGFTRVIERMRPRLERAGLMLEVREGADPRVRWDFGRMGQLLANLLENCARYATAPGRVQVHWQVEGEWLRLQVDDSGPGVDVALRPQLFEPLFRVDAARQRSTQGPGGSGLGLAICKAIVQAHGGTIGALQSPLAGLRIEALLPLVPPAAA